MFSLVKSAVESKEKIRKYLDDIMESDNDMLTEEMLKVRVVCVRFGSLSLKALTLKRDPEQCTYISKKRNNTLNVLVCSTWCFFPAAVTNASL
jgi:hypothetical protein